MRYDTRRADGKTRREYNEAFGVETENPDIPESFEYIWEWFWQLNKGVDRAGSGYCKRIEWAAYHGWASITGNLVRVDEYDMLREMDAAYVSEMDILIAEARKKDT